ncbi:MAG: VOC family protein [Undibacterium sp.]|nr:VOC family protein [Undibacterium sp.]
MKKIFGVNSRVDHVAIAVVNMEEALFLYRDIFGFEVQQQREVEGAATGMLSAELKAGGFSIVLVQGTSPESQVCRYIEKYGPGVQHLAVEVDNVEQLSDRLRASGVKFATDLIRGSNLVQIFTQRDRNSGMMFEFIERTDEFAAFEAGNIQKLFDQLEASESY